MIGNAVASTLMRLPVAELSALRKVFLASPNGLSLEGFVAAMLPPTTSKKESSGKSRGLHDYSASSSRRRSTGSLCRRSPPSSVPPGAGYSDLVEAGASQAGNQRYKNRRKRSASQQNSRQGRSRDFGDPGRDGLETPGIERRRSLKRRGQQSSGRRKGSRSKRGRDRSITDPLMWGDRDSGGGGGDGAGGLSLSEEERTGIVTDLVELFQQVDHNGDQVMEWDEFTGFVIDQVLSLTREAPPVDRLKPRPVGIRDTPPISRSSVRKVRYEPSLACAFACVGPIVKVWDPVMHHGTSYPMNEGCQQRQLSTTGDGSTTAATTIGRTEGFFAYASSEETRGFEIGSSAVIHSSLPPPEDALLGCSAAAKISCSSSSNFDSKTNSRGSRSLHKANPNKNRDGAPVSVVALDVKYIKANKLIMVLRSDLTLAFFLAEEHFMRVGLIKTSSQQYVLEYCPATGIIFTSGCDGSISSFVIETSTTADTDQQQQPHLLATATPIGVLRRHTDVVQDLLALNGTEAEGGPRLVSCGLDRRVCVWNSAKGIFAQSKHGNQAAIRSLAFDPRDNLLLGASVEGEVLAWDIWARLGGPLFRMQGHRSPVISVACAPGKGRAASLDDSGKMILWDTRRNASVDNNERYLCQLDCSSNRPTSLDVISNDSAGYLRWSHIGVSVVTTGRYMKVYDAVDPRVPEPPLSVALYSQKCVSFITCNGPFVTLWDGCTGKAIRTDRAMEGDIMRACLDEGDRRLLLASSLGEIVIYRFLQGTRIRTMSPGHDGPVSGMVYVKEDKLIVTGGWDRSLRVYDEVPREGDPPLLRQVERAHSSDINVVSVSHRLGLIASGSAGGDCRLWDYQFLSCEGSCNIGSEMLCVVFLEPHPLVAVGDAGGYVSIIPVRPWSQPVGDCGSFSAGNARYSSPLLRFANDQEAEGSIEGPASVTCLTHRGGGGMEGMILYTGDDKGTVRAWDLGGVLASAGCYDAPEEEGLPRSQKHYDPRRRFNKQAESTPRLPRHHSNPEAESHARTTGFDEALGDRHGCEPPSCPSLTTEADEAAEMGFGILEESTGATGREKLHHKSSKMGSMMSESCQIDTFVHGAPLIGRWTPHSEAVISLQVIQDPPCLLTGSRDRSVKLRALPAEDQQRRDTRFTRLDPAEVSSAQQPDQESQLEKKNLSRCHRENNSDVGAGSDPKIPSLSPARAKVEARQQKQHSSGADERPMIDREGLLLSSGCSSAAPPLAPDAATIPAPTSPSSKSTKSTTSSSTSAKIPQHGHDLSTLTLGRIDDGFRRDKYAFPVDLQGRGEGRAVEARAVLQAIEEIELRKEKRKKEEAALDRARGEAAAATAAGVASCPLQPLPTPTVVQPPHVGPLKRPTAEADPADAANAKMALPPPANAVVPVERSTPAVAALTATSEGEGAAERAGSPTSSLRKASALCGPETEVSTTRLEKQSTTVSPLRGGEDTNDNHSASIAGTICDGGVDNRKSGNSKRGHAMYGNMAVEELRVKNLEANSKAAARGAREAIAIRELLEPTTFLLSQMPDALSSYPAITTFLAKHGGAVSDGPRTLGTDPRAGHEGHFSRHNSEAIVPEASSSSMAPSLSPVVAIKRRRKKFTSSSFSPCGPACSSLQLNSSATGSSAPSSFNRVVGQQQPSLLDYSQQGVGADTTVQSGMRSVAGACVRGEMTASERKQSRHLIAEQGEAMTPTETGVMTGAAPKPALSETQEEFRGEGQLVGAQPDGRLAPLPPLQADDTHDPFPTSSTVGQRCGVKVSEAPQLHSGDEGWSQGLRWDRGGDGMAEGAGKPGGMMAKVKSRRSPRRKLPGYLSASPDSFGAASRWGALSKAHLEFHRLDTTGLLSSLFCPSLRRHSERIAPSSSVPKDADEWYHHLEHFREALTAARTGMGGTSTGRRATCNRWRQEGSADCKTRHPVVLADLDDMAQKHARAQAHWRRRLNAFIAEESSRSTSKNASKKSSGRFKLRRLVARKSAKRDLLAVGTKKKAAGWRLAENTVPMEGRRQEAESGGSGKVRWNDATAGEDILRAKTQFGPHTRNELFALWSAFGRASAFGNKVDARLLLQDPSMRDDTRYRKVLMEVLRTKETSRTGPILLAREDALLKLLPGLERSDAGMFLAAAKLAETDMERQGTENAGTTESSNNDHYAGEGAGVEVDTETLQELRALFDLYDVDRSGSVDIKEIVDALRGNYSTAQISAGMGDAVTEGELAALLSSLITATTTTAATATEGSGAVDARNNNINGKELEAGAATPELDFHGFVRLFQGVF